MSKSSKRWKRLRAQSALERTPQMLRNNEILSLPAPKEPTSTEKRREIRLSDDCFNGRRADEMDLDELREYCGLLESAVTTHDDDWLKFWQDLRDNPEARLLVDRVGRLGQIFRGREKSREYLAHVFDCFFFEVDDDKLGYPGDLVPEDGKPSYEQVLDDPCAWAEACVVLTGFTSDQASLRDIRPILHGENGPAEWETLSVTVFEFLQPRFKEHRKKLEDFLRLRRSVNLANMSWLLEHSQGLLSYATARLRVLEEQEQSKNVLLFALRASA